MNEFWGKYKLTIIGIVAFGLIGYVSYYFYTSYKINFRKNLTIGVVDNIKSLDFHTPKNITELRIIRDVFSGLLDVQHDNKVVLDLASSVTLSPDKKTYTFKIKENAMWSDGTPITSNDFAKAYFHILDPKFNSELASSFYSIKGARGYKEGREPPQSVGISAPDSKTLVIELTSPSSSFLYYIAINPIFYPIPLHIHSIVGDKWNAPENIVYSGPYRVNYFDKAHIELIKNDVYPDVDTLPIENVKYMFYETYEDAYNAYKLKKIDLLYNVSNDEIVKFNTEKTVVNPNVVSQPDVGIGYLIINSRSKSNFLLNYDIRKLIAILIDRVSLSKIITKYGSGTYKSFFPSNPEINITYNSPYDFITDIEKIDLVASTISSNVGFELKYQNDNKRQEEVAKFLKSTLSKYKIFITLIPISSEQFAKDIKIGNYEAILMDIQPVVPFDVEYYTGAISTSPSVGLNYANYTNDDILKLLYKNNIDSIHEHYSSLEEIILRDNFYIPLYTISDYFFKNNYIAGINKNKSYHTTKFIKKQ